MEFISRSDIFFFITSIAVAVVTVVLVVAGFYFVKILKNFYEISNTINKAVRDASEKIMNIKTWIKKSSLLDMVLKGFGEQKNKKKSNKNL